MKKKSGVYNVLELLDATKHIEYVQKKFKLAATTIDVEVRRKTAISTGLLTTDLLLNGGIYPGGWFTFFGPEQSAKSTHIMTVMASLYYSNVPVIFYFDCEGATSPDYIETIAKTSNVKRSIDIKKVFGIKNPNNDKWVIEPRIWYSSESSLEGIWKSISAFLKKLPDKIFIEGKWYLLFDNTKENQSRLKGLGNPKIGKPHGKIAIEALDGGTSQALILIDSYPAMVADLDDEDEGSNALGIEARGHSKNVKKVKTKLKRKHCTVVGVNQIRDAINIGNPYGPKEYEPGGNALKFHSDARISQRPRSIPHAKGHLEKEPSIENGDDTYRYICMRTIKNKFGAPYLEGWYRIWVSDSKGFGHGFCPVYDTWNYLKETNQVKGSIGKKINIHIEGLKLPTLTWMDFKNLILLTGNDLRNYCKKLKIRSNPEIRKKCFNQIKTGEGVTRYFSKLNGLDINADYSSMGVSILRSKVLELDLANKSEMKGLKKPELIQLLNDAEI